MTSRRGWRRNRRQKHTRFFSRVRLPVEELQASLPDHYPCCVPGANGRVWWIAHIPTVAAQLRSTRSSDRRRAERSEAHRLEWAQAVPLLLEDRLTASIDGSGHVHVAYLSTADARQAQANRKALSDLLFFAGAKDLKQYWAMERARSARPAQDEETSEELFRRDPPPGWEDGKVP